VIVVGGRGADSPTAMLLARKGYKVLVVDRASFPSDTVWWLSDGPSAAGIRTRRRDDTRDPRRHRRDVVQARTRARTTAQSHERITSRAR